VNSRSSIRPRDRRGIARLRSQRGSELIEFALVSTLLFLVIFGTVEFSRMIFAYDIISNATREGVRYAAVRGSASGHAATESAVQSYVASRSYGQLASSDVSVTWSPDNSPGSTVQITTSHVFQTTVPFLPARVLTLDSTASMIVTH
jgi:Flp pilus assembly protein TadG